MLFSGLFRRDGATGGTGAMRNTHNVPLYMSRMSRLLNTPIRVRLTLWYVLLLALILVLFSGMLYLILDNGLDRQVDDDLRLSAEQALGVVKQENGRLLVQRLEGESEIAPLVERGVLVRIVGMDGQVVESAGPFRALKLPPDVLTSAARGQPMFLKVNAPGDGTPLRLYSVPYQESGRVYGAVVVGQSLKPIQDTLHDLLLILALVVPVTLAFASVGGLFLANRALLPIDRITRAAQRIGAQDLSQRLELVMPADEVGRLARTFNDMLDRLEDAFHRQRQFTADASHELRTPLAIIKGNIGVTLNRPRKGAEYQEVLANLEEEVDRLTRLVEDLLLLARAEAPQPVLQSESLELVGLLEVVADQVRPLADAKGIELILHLPEELSLHGDPDTLVRLFLNLLDNAVKYTPEGGQITLRAEVCPGEQVAVEVTDTGRGIPAEQLAHIFERFYRADEARSRADGGSGLGLALAKWIAEAHGGSIQAQSEPGLGSTFTVRLPKLAEG